MIPNVPPFNNYSGNNYVTKFDYDLSIDNENQLVVLHTDSSEIQRELKLNVDYSIHGVGDPDGGYIIFPLASSSYGLLQEDEVISLYLSLPQEQQTPFGTSDKLDMNILEKTFDYIVKLIKIISRQVDRSVKIQEGSKISPAELISSLKTSEINAVKSALNAGVSAQNAKESADIAAQKADEVSETYTEAMADITGTTQEALDDIETARQAGVTGIQNLNAETLSRIGNAKNTALTDINTSKTNALNSITEDLNSAKDELLGTKAEIITDLIENATGEALTAVENVKNTAITTINQGVESAEEELETLINNAKNEANTHISTVETNVNNIIQTAQNAINEVKSDVESKANEFSNYAELAKKYAENPLDTEVENGTYSAKHWAQKAEQSASAVENPLNKDLTNISDVGTEKIKEIAGSIVPDVDFSSVSDKNLSNITGIGEQKIKDVIASVGSEIVRLPLAINKADKPITEIAYMALPGPGPSGSGTAAISQINGVTFNPEACEIIGTAYSYQSIGSTEYASYSVNNTFNSYDTDNIANTLNKYGKADVFIKWTLTKEEMQGDLVWGYIDGAGSLYSKDFTVSDYTSPYIFSISGDNLYQLQEKTSGSIINPTTYYAMSPVYPHSQLPSYIPLGYLAPAEAGYEGQTYRISGYNGDLKFVEYPVNTNWFNIEYEKPAPYLKCNENGQQKIKDIIASVGNEPVYLPLNFNSGEAAEIGGTIIPQVGGGNVNMLQYAKITATSDNPFIATLFNGSKIKITQDYYEYFSEYNLLASFGAAVLTGASNAVLFADVEKIQNGIATDEELGHFKFGIIIEATTEAMANAHLANMLEYVSQNLGNSSLLGFYQETDVMDIALLHSLYGNCGDVVLWYNPDTHSFCKLDEYDSQAENPYIWASIDESYKYVPLGLMELDTKTYPQSGIASKFPYQGGKYCNVIFMPYDANQFNWFNVELPVPYLKANLSNITEEGKNNLNNLIEKEGETSAASASPDYNNARAQGAGTIQEDGWIYIATVTSPTSSTQALQASITLGNFTVWSAAVPPRGAAAAVWLLCKVQAGDVLAFNGASGLSFNVNFLPSK